MILGTLVTNIRNNQILARMREPVYNEKIEYFLLEFMNSTTKKTGVLTKDLYKYIYLFNEDHYYVLITSIFYNEAKAFKILEYIINNNPLDMLVSIDNVIFDENIIFPNLSLIMSMDSQEEKIYNMMMKNKELEVRRRQKEMKYKKNKSAEWKITKQVEAMKVNEMKVKEMKVTDSSRKGEETKIKRFETSSSPVFICLKERLKCTVDIENNLKSIEVLGEMTLNIKDQDLKSLEIHLEGNYKDCKFSPKLNKEVTYSGIIKSEKPFSLNKNIALLKWKDLKERKIPIEFTFWPSEIKLNTYQISLEFTTEKALENLLITIPKNKLSNIQSEDLKEKGDFLEWSVGNVSEGDSDSLEFQCKCSDPTDVFPIEVYFTTPDCYRDIKVGQVLCGDQALDCVDTKKILEVDSFRIVNE